MSTARYLKKKHSSEHVSSGLMGEQGSAVETREEGVVLPQQQGAPQQNSPQQQGTQQHSVGSRVKCQQPLLGARLPVDTTAKSSTPASGAGVGVAVIDTGSATPGVSGDRDACLLHGTAVATVIQQVAPNVKIRSYRHSDQHGRMEGTVSTLVRAINDAVGADAAGARVKIINISMVACQDTIELRDAILHAQRAGVLVIASTGNTGQCEAGQTPYPAALPGVIAVGAVNPLYQRAEFAQQTHPAQTNTMQQTNPAQHSNSAQTSNLSGSGSQDLSANVGRIPASYSAPGPWADIFAAGGPVSAQWERSPGVVETVVGSPEPFVGTSFATPIITATAARVWEIIPWASAQEVADIVLNTATPGGALEGMKTPIRVVDTQAAVDKALSIAEQRHAHSHRKQHITAAQDTHSGKNEAVVVLPSSADQPLEMPAAVSFIVPLMISVVLAVVCVIVIVQRGLGRHSRLSE